LNIAPDIYRRFLTAFPPLPHGVLEMKSGDNAIFTISFSPTAILAISCATILPVFSKGCFYFMNEIFLYHAIGDFIIRGDLDIFGNP